MIKEYELTGVFIYLLPSKNDPMIRFYATTFLTLLLLTPVYSQTKSPAAFLGYELGEQFSQHHQVLNYFNHVAETNSNVKLLTYGETYEKRPLTLAFISSEENMKKKNN